MQRSLKQQLIHRIARRNARRAAAAAEKSKWDDPLIDNDETLNILDPTYIKLPNGSIVYHPLANNKPIDVQVSGGTSGVSNKAAREDHTHDLIIPDEIVTISRDSESPDTNLDFWYTVGDGCSSENRIIFDGLGVEITRFIIS